MQDRFKFRIWDNVNNKMAHLLRHFNAVMVNGTVCIVESFQNMNGFYKKKVSKEFDDAVLMQCTGLKDKKGKLIYEGDIVKFSSIYGHGIFEIKWNDEFAMYGFEDEETDFTDLRCFIENGAYIEILGNLYENPELLKSN